MQRLLVWLQQYVQLGKITKFNPEFEDDVNNDSGN